jgi:poly(3-hydroxybutyrate) depolymerase
MGGAQAGTGPAGMGGLSGDAGSSAGSDRGGMSGDSGAGGAPGGMGGQSGGGACGTAGAGGTAGAAGGSAGSAGAGGGMLSAGCGKMPTIASSMYNNGNPISITAANRQRRYILSVPTNYDNNKPYNLVIAWHQLDGNDKQMYSQNYYWLKDIAEAASSTIFVAPNGEKNGTPCTGMSVAEGGCGWPDSSGSNVALADAVVAQVEENFCIDKSRIFANGWSYGGSMSYRTACSRPLGGTGDWGVRAVAVYNGAAQLSSGGCTPSKAVAFYASHGTNDNVLGYDGGVSMATTYARLNGCTAMTPTRASGNHVCTNYMGCTAGYPVEFCSFVGPHTPDPPREGGQRWQPQEVWQFFSEL